MVNKIPNTTHLKQGRAYPDPIATAKVQGKHFSDSANYVKVTPTPDSKTESDGKLKLPSWAKWTPINPAVAPNTTTGKGGSKRA
jgi:hypothetical protein